MSACLTSEITGGKKEDSVPSSLQIYGKGTVGFEEEIKKRIKPDCHLGVNVTRRHEAVNAIPVGS